MISDKSLFSPGHFPEGLLSHSEDVGVHGPHVLPPVGIDDILTVQGQLLIGVDCHQHDA